MSKIVACGNDIKDVLYSGYTIVKVYACGGELVYEKRQPEPDPDNYKLRMYFNNGLVGYLPCDSSSAITVSEVQKSHWIEVDGISRSMPYSSITGIAVGDCVKTIESGAFSGMTNIERIVSLGTNLEQIKSNAFKDCSGVTGVFIPCSCTTIGDYAFSGCSSVVQLNICAGVQSIGRYAFAGLTSYASAVNIPSSITSIGNGAFYNMENATRFNVNPSTPPSLPNGNNTFFVGSSATSAKIYVKSLSAYKLANGWREYYYNLEQL